MGGGWVDAGIGGFIGKAGRTGTVKTAAGWRWGVPPLGCMHECGGSGNTVRLIGPPTNSVVLYNKCMIR